MTLMKTLKTCLSLGAAGAAVLFAASATAQSWSGAYVGGSVGWASARDDGGETILFDRNLDGSFNDTVTTSAGANAFSPGFCGGSANGPTPSSGCADDEDGAELGLHAGYDWQYGALVFGGLVEISGADDLSDSVAAFSTTPAFYTMTRELESLAAVRGRVGYAVGRFLPYVTAGVARGEVEHRFATNNSVNTFTQRGDEEASGHQLGVGVETMIAPRLSLGLEYLHTKLEDDDHRVRAAGPAPATNPFILGNANGTDFKRSNEDFEFGAFRLKAAVRF
jgi:outer membrane immunogenic protein